MRKIIVNSIEYEYIIGKSHVMVKNKETGKRVFCKQHHEILGVSLEEFQDEDSWWSITPKHIADAITLRHMGNIRKIDSEW